MPAIWLHEDGLKVFGWGPRSTVRGSTAIAALQLYVTMLTRSQELWRGERCLLTCEDTYNRLSVVTGLSRALVAAGVEGLVEAERIVVEKEGRNNLYIFPDYDQSGRWCKLPARALYNKRFEYIEPFKHFHKRAKCELDALKLFLFYAANRDNYSYYSMCSFETINTKTGVAEKQIPPANSFLVSTGLVTKIDREQSEKGSHRKEANKYFLRGNGELTFSPKTTASSRPTGPTKVPARTI
ncbi:DNA-binding protein [Pseudomonas sp. B2M1-30]|uniref:DNA-binding protein n=1 Tax=Pseudomonas TaxID=286 RepID=UPI0021C9F22A|nr:MULTISPECIES: DNA-binding protein [Pseudomonas]MCU0120534.1 DNA-binding protein [Pseudomonas sp. B2M1-30]MCU7262552.1 DNA-binding protein [Pseudomonas koreensis]